MALKSKPPIEFQILDYLDENPAAQDTLKGITEWWLLRQVVLEASAEVEAALKGLVSAGKLSARTGADGSVHYYRPCKAAPKRPSKLDGLRKRHD